MDRRIIGFVINIPKLLQSYGCYIWIVLLHYINIKRQDKIDTAESRKEAIA